MRHDIILRRYNIPPPSSSLLKRKTSVNIILRSFGLSIVFLGSIGFVYDSLCL